MSQPLPPPRASPRASAAAHAGPDVDGGDEELGLDFRLETAANVRVPPAFEVKTEGDRTSYRVRV